MQLLITIDTEGDNCWERTSKVTTENARYLPRFQAMCEKYRFKPTYLATYEMATDEFFVEFAKDALKQRTCEIGSHPHAWNSPPIYNLTSDDMRLHPYLLEYPEEIMRQKVKVLTNLLEDTFEIKMYSHRAGRWGLNAVYTRILAELDYRVDCSVTPYKKWDAELRVSGEPPCPDIDFRSFPTEAYFLDAEDISKQGNLGILELPMTIIPHYGKLLSWFYSILPGGNARRVTRAVFGRPASWFRPHRVYRELLRVARYKIDEGADYIMFMMHSSELMPGGSPTFRHDKDIEVLYNDIEATFDFLKTNCVSGVTCQEYYESFTKPKEELQGA